MAAQKPLELILARNLLTSISTPAFLVDQHADLVFYNEAAGALLGRSFEDVGRMSPEEWTSTYGPFDANGRPVELDELPTTRAVRDGDVFVGDVAGKGLGAALVMSHASRRNAAS